MSGNTLVKCLAGWVGSTLCGPGNRGREHCFQIRSQVRIPGAGRVDLLTLRHETGGPDRFRVDLWNILPGHVGERDVDAMMRRTTAFQAWYAELIEHAETQGFSPGHRVSVHGNLVGRSVCRSRFVGLLSNWGSSIFFWTWRRAGSGVEIVPAYDRAPALKSARETLKGLLNHLPWKDTGEWEESGVQAVRATT
jgi:hypothetical protein